MRRLLETLLKTAVWGGIVGLLGYLWLSGHFSPPPKPKLTLNEAYVECIADAMFWDSSAEIEWIPIAIAMRNHWEKGGVDPCTNFWEWRSMRKDRPERRPRYKRQEGFADAWSGTGAAKQAVLDGARAVAKKVLTAEDPESLLPEGYKHLQCAAKYWRPLPWYVRGFRRADMDEMMVETVDPVTPPKNPGALRFRCPK